MCFLSHHLAQPGRLPIAQADMQFAQLLVIDHVRRVGHEAGGVTPPVTSFVGVLKGVEEILAVLVAF